MEVPLGLRAVAAFVAVMVIVVIASAVTLAWQRAMLADLESVGDATETDDIGEAFDMEPHQAGSIDFGFDPMTLGHDI